MEVWNHASVITQTTHIITKENTMPSNVNELSQDPFFYWHEDVPYIDPTYVLKQESAQYEYDMVFLTDEDLLQEISTAEVING